MITLKVLDTNKFNVRDQYEYYDLLHEQGKCSKTKF